MIGLDVGPKGLNAAEAMLEGAPPGGEDVRADSAGEWKSLFVWDEFRQGARGSAADFKGFSRGEVREEDVREQAGSFQDGLVAGLGQRAEHFAKECRGGTGYRGDGARRSLCGWVEIVCCGSHVCSFGSRVGDGPANLLQ